MTSTLAELETTSQGLSGPPEPETSVHWHLRAWMQHAKAALYLQQIAVLVSIRIVPCISVDSHHGWTWEH
jgi:hypothetical protein